MRDLKKMVRVTVQRAASLLMPTSPSSSLSIAALLADVESSGVINQFHALWYSSAAIGQVRWQGHQVLKNPLDLWIYQEIIFSHRPDVLIETGTHRGGSALYFSMIAQLSELPMEVVTIDINPKIDFDASANRIFPIVGISTTSSTFAKVESHLRMRQREFGRDLRIMVVLDSDHSRENVLEELRLYAPLVTPGLYLVIEDTNVNGHPVFAQHGSGPYEAVTEFLREHPEFCADRECEKYLLTFNPNGWLKRLY